MDCVVVVGTYLQLGQPMETETTSTTTTITITNSIRSNNNIIFTTSPPTLGAQKWRGHSGWVALGGDNFARASPFFCFVQCKREFNCLFHREFYVGMCIRDVDVEQCVCMFLCSSLRVRGDNAFFPPSFSAARARRCENLHSLMWNMVTKMM